MNRVALFVAASLGAFVFGVISTFWGQVVVPGLGDFANAVLLANPIGLVICSLVCGSIIDKHGAKPVMIAGMALVALGVFGMGFASESQVFCIIMALCIGIGGSAIVTGANVLVSDIADNAAARGKIANHVNNFFAVGVFIAGFAFGALTGAGAKMPQLALAMGILGTAICIFYIAVKFPPAAARGESMFDKAKAVLSRGMFWALAASLFLYVGVEGSVWYWLNKHLTGGLKFSADNAGVVISVVALGIIAGRLVSSVVLSKRILGNLQLTLVGAICTAICFTGLLFAEDMLAACVLAGLAGASMGPMFPTLLAATGSAFPNEVGSAIGLCITGGWLGYVFIPPTVGYAQKWGVVSDLRTGLFLTSGAAILMVVTNIIALSLLRRHHPHEN